MIDKYGKCISKGEPLKATEENDAEPENLEFIYRNRTNPERDKSSGVSSDDETTSSSIRPIPDTLRQMRNELKKSNNNVGELSEMESVFATFNVVNESPEKIRNSLNKLRRKYTLNNETSVALKMNSANLMLDDILKNTDLKFNYEDKFQSFFKEPEHHTKIVREIESSATEESVSSRNHCNHLPMAPVLAHPVPPVHFNFSPTPCPRHGNTLYPICGCTSPPPPPLVKNLKDLKAVDNHPVQDNQRKQSLVKKLQNFQVGNKIMSIYKIMQKTNPFSKDRSDSISSAYNQQGIPGGSSPNNLPVDDPSQCKCNNLSCKKKYPKRIIFDLVESSESSRTDSKSGDTEPSVDSEERKDCTCQTELKCTCPVPVPVCPCRDCGCPRRNSQSSTDLSPRKTLPESQEEVSESGKEQEIEKKEKSQEKKVEIITEEKKNEEKFIPEKEYEDPYTGKHTEPPLDKKIKGKSYCLKERKFLERTDIYYFDHGNSAYYRTTDTHPVRYTECLVERTDHYATKFWAELFGFLEIGIAFLIAFLIQLYRFFFTSIIRALLVGIIQIFTDYFLKPLLTIIFNGMIQPFLILAYNTATSFRDLCLPISQTFGFFAKEIAGIIRSCRLVEIHPQKQSSCNCGNKV